MKSIKIEIWEKYLEKILKNSQVSITVTDMEGNFIIFSKGAEFLTGYSADEVVGKMKVKDFYANSEDAERIAAEVVKSDLIENFETLIKRKDGRAVPINIFVSLLRDDDGNPIGSIGVSVDISEKKRLQEKLRLSEEKYRILVEQSNDAIYILQEGKFVYINPKFKEILGYSLEETTAENFNFMNLVARESRPMIEERARKVEKGESLPLRYEFKGLSKEKEKKQ
ncbi:MAG: PAS domain-containing protein, partial [Fidelibacterota bacterium]